MTGRYESVEGYFADRPVSIWLSSPSSAPSPWSRDERLYALDVLPTPDQNMTALATRRATAPIMSAVLREAARPNAPLPTTRY